MKIKFCKIFQMCSIKVSHKCHGLGHQETSSSSSSSAFTSMETPQGGCSKLAARLGCASRPSSSRAHTTHSSSSIVQCSHSCYPSVWTCTCARVFIHIHSGSWLPAWIISVQAFCRNLREWLQSIIIILWTFRFFSPWAVLHKITAAFHHLIVR